MDQLNISTTLGETAEQVQLAIAHINPSIVLLEQQTLGEVDVCLSKNTNKAFWAPTATRIFICNVGEWGTINHSFRSAKLKLIKDNSEVLAKSTAFDTMYQRLMGNGNTEF